MAYLAASSLNRNKRRSSSPSELSLGDRYQIVMADDLQRGDAAKFAKHISEFFSELASELPRKKMVEEILHLKPMMYAVLY